MSKVPPFAASIWLAIFLSLASTLLLYYIVDYARDAIKATQSVGWPSVNALVVSSRVVGGCGRGHAFSPDVAYTYTVSGIEHTSHQFAYGIHECMSEAEARDIASRYPTGSRVAVRVNPSLPEESVIESELSGPTWPALVLGPPMFLFFCYATYKAFRRLHQPRGA